MVLVFGGSIVVLCVGLFGDQGNEKDEVLLVLINFRVRCVASCRCYSTLAAQVE